MVDRELAQILRRIRAGEEEGMRQLYDATRRRVYGLALFILGDASHAEEVTLDTYMHVWRKAETFDKERGDPMTWLLLLTRSRAIDRLRRVRRERARVSDDERAITDEVEDASAGPEQIFEASERASAVRTAMAGLAPEQREALGAAFFRGLSHSGVAAYLELPLGTVKTRIRAGLANLRRALARDGSTS